MNEQDERGDDGDHHAGERYLIAAAGGGRAVHQVQADHEQRRDQHVDELDGPGEPAHGWTLPARLSIPRRPRGGAPCPLSAGSCSSAFCSGAFRRNIFSIRPVTAYPPTTFALAKNEAT